MSSRLNNPRRTRLRNIHPPSLQRQDATVRSPILEAITAEVEAAWWRTIAHQYVAVFDQNDPIGSEERAIAFLRAIAGGDDPTADLMSRHICEEMERNPELYTWRQTVWRNMNPEDGHPNPPPPYTAHPTKGEITVEMSPEVVLPEYTPPYTPFGQDPKWQYEDEDEEEEGEVIEDDEEKRERFLLELAAANPEPTLPFLDGQRIPVFIVEESLLAFGILVVIPLIFSLRIDFHLLAVLLVKFLLADAK